MQFEPVWLRSSKTDGKDHLVRPGNASVAASNGRGIELVAWCSLTLTNAEPGGNHSQCRICLREVKAYMERALTEPPPRIVERVLVTVDRPRDGGHHDAATVIEKKLARLTSWKVTVTPVFQDEAAA